MCKMPKCSFKFCKNMTSRILKKDGVSYFRFPRKLFRQEKWIEIVRRQRGDPFFKPNTASVVCSKHFNESDLYVTAKGITRLIDKAVPRIDSTLDMNCEEENSTQLTSFEYAYVPGSGYLGYDYSSDTSDSNENCGEIKNKIKIDKAHLDMTCTEIKKEIEDINNTELTSCEDSSQSGVNNHRNPNSNDTSNTNIKDESDFKIRKKIKFEVEDPSPNITEEYLDDRLDELMGTRFNCYEKFGEKVATMLKRMPLQQALDLQLQIVKLITSTMNNGYAIKTVLIKTEDELCEKEN